MIWRHAEGNQRPRDVEAIAGGRYMIRQNIKKESRTDANGAAFELWTYDEAVASTAEYAAYYAVQTAELKREAEIVDDYTLKLIEEGTL